MDLTNLKKNIEVNKNIINTSIIDTYQSDYRKKELIFKKSNKYILQFFKRIIEKYLKKKIKKL